jgi:predicted membrane channel-forming protein YqfA (hemolysin III family)
MANKHKGWFRLWLVISIVWWIAGGIFFIHAWNENVFHTETAGIVQGVLDGKTANYGNDEFQWEVFLTCVSMSFFSPVFFYVFGKAVYWIFKGFKPDEEGTGG